MSESNGVLPTSARFPATPTRRGSPHRRGGPTPELSRFLGIVIVMYYNDHSPPHFHAWYGGVDITVRIADGLVEGRFPRRATNLVLEWYGLHRDELLEAWMQARERRPLRRIDPLEWKVGVET